VYPTPVRETFSPLATLQKYAHALGYRLELRFVKETPKAGAGTIRTSRKHA